jgi:hypothetical protein
LQGRHEQTMFDESLLDLWAERRKGDADGSHKWLIGRGRALRNEQVGSVGRKEIPVSVETVS